MGTPILVAAEEVLLAIDCVDRELPSTAVTFNECIKG
jgi:hypothetical protein